jgi:photosystem II stability/assembly factor-like uncharacterized protein
MASLVTRGIIRRWAFSVVRASLLFGLISAQTWAGTGGPEREQEFLKVLHAPYGTSIPADVRKTMWDKVNAMPSEPASVSSIYQWRSLGPSGFNINDSPTGLGRWMGRVLDLEVNPSVETRFAAASGGLWGFAGIQPYPMSDQLNTLVVGTFATNPTNTNTIILGTGEFLIRGGTGIWRTTDAGQTWSATVMNSVPNVVFKVRYDPLDPSIVHAVTDFGYYRSTDGGITWSGPALGVGCTDIAFTHTATGPRIYVPVWGQGLWNSTDDGVNWTKVSSSVLPTSDMGRAAIAVSAIDPASTATHIYMSVGTSAKPYNALNGLYRSDDGGLRWINISPAVPLAASQLWYDDAIAVSPKDYRYVIFGSTKDYRTTDAGQTWTLIDNLDPNNHDNTHDDWHVFRWLDDGLSIYAGNDGGLSFSGDAGVTWNSVVNNAPITQFYGVDVSAADGQVIVGGAQDNGGVVSGNGGTDWLGTICCDAWSPAIDPSNSSRVYIVQNSSRFRSTDGGLHWTGINNGLGGAGVIRTDGGSSTTTPIVYTIDNTNVFYSTNYGDAWQSLTAGSPLPASVYGIETPRINAAGPQVYAIMNANSSGASLQYYYQGTWKEVSSGFPAPDGTNTRVRSVRVHPRDQRIVFAVMAGVDGNSDGQKIFKSYNRGGSWQNITGNMPNIPLTDIAIDPNNDNNLYLGSDMGCFRTSDGGTTWWRWNDGMPQANLVTELHTATINGTLYVVAGSYGRSIWIRDASTSDPSKYANLHKVNVQILPDKHGLDTLAVNPGDILGVVSGVTVQLDTLLHPAVQNLVLILHHGGIDDTLYNRTAPVAVPPVNFTGTLFDDSAPKGIADGIPPFTGAFRPAQPLTQFNNVPPEGPWVLDVFQAAGSDTGTLKEWGLAIQPETISSVNSDQRVPISFTLEQNFPNPFNPSTTISYAIPAAAHVRLVVYDLLGRTVAVLVDSWESSGRYSVRFDGSQEASGVYLYRLEAGKNELTRKLVLLK